jgi:proline racemase
MARRVFFCIDAHTCGNPVRVVAGGAPLLPHVSMAERREIFVRDHDWVRRALMFEPRGHDCMSGSILYPPSRTDCDIGVLFIEVSGCLPMCGHGAIGTVTAALEAGLITPAADGRLALETPAGRVEAQATFDGARVASVSLVNVASYLHAKDVMVQVEGLGEIRVDCAYGGNFYVIVEPQENWPGLDTMNAAAIATLSPRVRAAAQAKIAPIHRQDSRIAGVSHVMWCAPPRHKDATARNAVFYGEKGIDRSPCGTGSSARMAQLHARGALRVGERFVHESIIGTMFTCSILSETRLGDHAAIIPKIAGWAHVTGHNTIFVDDSDPLAHGFQLV